MCWVHLEPLEELVSVGGGGGVLSPCITCILHTLAKMAPCIHMYT